MKMSRMLIPIALAILSIHLSPAAAAFGQLDIWTWRNPLPTGNQLNGVSLSNLSLITPAATEI